MNDAQKSSNRISSFELERLQKEADRFREIGVWFEYTVLSLIEEFMIANGRNPVSLITKYPFSKSKEKGFVAGYEIFGFSLIIKFDPGSKEILRLE